MKPSLSESGRTVYRLHGLLDGVERTFDLPQGELRVGSSPAADVRLFGEGVSREHALLKVTPGGLVVEDRGSKNGTFVDLSRVRRASVPVGARITVGSVDLLVQEVDAEDVELALAIEGGTEDGAKVTPLSQGSLETVTFSEAAESGIETSWLELLGGFAERLFATPGGEVRHAFAYLVDTLEAQGGCFVEWLDERPVLLAHHGEIRELPPPLDVEAPEAPRFHTDSTVSSTVLAGGQAPPRGLLVWGDFAGRSRSEALLRTVLRLLSARCERSEGDLAQGREPTVIPELAFSEDFLPSVSPAMRALYRQMRAAARADLPILLAGETGVGKERLAELLHRSSGRGGPFLALNCAAIPSELLEAELFGIGRGVATGVEARTGKFQLAAGGTLFLDEIGEMQPALQAKLLRALEEKHVQPVGGAPQRIDVRIVAATNADLDRQMAAGTFRRDLYYRLTGFLLEVPPLRECPQDVPRLIEHFLAHNVRASGIRVRGITVKAMKSLTAYAWPGNVRELQHEIRRLVSLCSDGDAIDTGKLSRRILEAGREELMLEETFALKPQVQELERRVIRRALEHTRGGQAKAARLLGLSRNTLSDKLKRLAIDPQSFDEEE